LAASVDGRRGTNARRTAAATASPAPTQSRAGIDGQVERTHREPGA
jgi:hypothetical protein